MLTATPILPNCGPVPAVEQPATDISSIPGLRELWSQTLGDPRICIAVLDGPVDLSHPVFRGAALTQIPIAGVTSSGGYLSDHGTHVTSILFGQHHSSVKGIAPRCRGLCIPIFDYAADGSLQPCSQERLATAIRTALHFGANIINISAGEFTNDGAALDDLQAAIAECEQKAIIVAAAGNDGCPCIHIPGALPSVLAVGAMSLQGEPLPFSNWGDAYQEHGVLAPGEHILGASLNGRVAQRTGTSFATPIVSGIAGLLLSEVIKTEQLPSPNKLRGAILRSTIDCQFQPTSDCSRLLTGRLNVSGVIEALNRGTNEMYKTEIHETTEVSVPAMRQFAQVQASGCGCGCQSPPELVYAIGRLSYEFQSLARERSIRQHMDAIPGRNHSPDPKNVIDLLRYLRGYHEIAIEDIGIGRIKSLSKDSGRYLLTLDGSIVVTNDDVKRKIQLDGLKNLSGSSSRLNGLHEIRKVDTTQNSVLLQAIHDGESYLPNSGTLLLPRRCAKQPRVFPAHLYDAAAVIWTLERDGHPFSAIAPQGPFSEEAYGELVDFLLKQSGLSKASLDCFYYSGPGETNIAWMYGWDPRFNDSCCFASVVPDCCENYQGPAKPVKTFPPSDLRDETSQVAIPGQLAGVVTLLDRNVVPVIKPDMRGSEAWSYREIFNEPTVGPLDSFVDTLFYRFSEEIRNDGRSPEDRALNFASTQLLMYLSDSVVYNRILANKLELNEILPPKPARGCPPNSQCYTIELTLFDPDKINRANTVVSVTVDVSDVVPVLLDGPREFQRR